jgi:hypothetical protein
LIARLAVLLVALLLLPVAGAQADTYCVNVTPCNAPMHDDGTSFSQALQDAKTRLGPDTIMLGSPVLTTPGGFSYDTPIPGNTVAIVGTGGRGSGQRGTTLESSAASPSNQTILTVTGAPGSSISGIDVVVPSGSSNTGIVTNGTASNIVVEPPTAGTASPTGVTLAAGGALLNSEVDMPTDVSGSLGVFLTGAGILVDGSTIRGARALQTSTGAGGAVLSGTVRRSEIVSSVIGVEIDAGDFTVEDTLLRNATDLPGAGHDGAGVSAFNGNTTLALNHVTMADPSATGTALRAHVTSAHSAALTAHNSVLSGYAADLNRNASGGGTANIATDYSDYAGPTGANTGPGSITETNHLAADPGFVSESNFRLRSDSPMVDAGDPAGLTADESPTDADGRPRIVDGGGDCVARRDVGAFEFQPGERAPVAVATVATLQPATDQAVQFDASQSCDPDGDALTYAWAFDDGSGGEGVTRERAFSRAGLHFAAVTVTDSTGRSSTAVAAVRVIRPELPPFAGITIPKQTVRVSKSGIAGVKLRCPLGTVGACSGTVTLGRAGDRKMGSASVAIARGATRKVNVKLTRRGRAALKKAKRLNATVTVAGRDANGTAHRTKGTIKLVAPRS